MKTKLVAVILAATLLCSCGSKPKENQETSVTKSTAAQELIAKTDAAKIALDDAKLNSPETVAKLLENVGESDIETEMSALNGIPIYIVDFEYGGMEFEYEIDSQNGTVRNYKRLWDFSAVKDEGTALSDVEIADYTVWYLDVDPSAVENMTVKQFKDLGFCTVNFNAEGKDYKCWTGIYSGQLLRSNVDIGPSRAEELCIQHIINSTDPSEAEDVTNLMLSNDVEISSEAEGVSSERKYKVEIKAGGYVYEYEVDGLSGMILSAKCDLDEDCENPIGGFENGIEIVQPEVEDVLTNDSWLDENT